LQERKKEDICKYILLFGTKYRETLLNLEGGMNVVGSLPQLVA
jgi:hypothetical protein